MNEEKFLYEIYKNRTKGLTKEETSKELYINLGKKTIYNPQFQYGDMYDHLNIFYKKPRIFTDDGRCISICNIMSEQYKQLMNMCDIDSEIEIDYTNNNFDTVGILHEYNINYINGKKYKTNLTYDLFRVHCGLKVTHFATNKGTSEKPYDTFSEEQLEDVDRKINYLNKSYGYTNTIIDTIENILQDSKQTTEQKIDFFLKNVSNYVNVETMGPVEKMQLYSHLLINNNFAKKNSLDIWKTTMFSKINSDRYNHSFLFWTKLKKENNENTLFYVFDKQDNNFKKFNQDNIVQFIDKAGINLEDNVPTHINFKKHNVIERF